METNFASSRQEIAGTNDCGGRVLRLDQAQEFLGCLMKSVKIATGVAPPDGSPRLPGRSLSTLGGVSGQGRKD